MSNRSHLIPAGFPRLPLKNGIGRVVCQLKRMTIKFCKSSGSSSGIRSFIESDLLDFSRNNPEVAIYLKPRRHHSPVVISEYRSILLKLDPKDANFQIHQLMDLDHDLLPILVNGESHYMSFNNFTRDNTNKWLNFIRSRVGVPTTKFRKLQHTELPSVQGVWSPFTNRDPKLNVTSFPNDELNVPYRQPMSASEILRLRFKEQKLRESEDVYIDKNLKIEVQR